MEGATLHGSRSSGSVFSELRVAGFNVRFCVAIVLLVLTSCQSKAETLSPDLDLVYQQAHPAVILGLPDDEIHESGAAVKRLQSFMPMRGRRGPDGVYSDNEDKRGSSFLPSRGKKEQDDSMVSIADSLDGPSGPKRASAFMAMRGRRLEGQGGTLYDTVDELDEDYYKRAGFMPMRGRKSAFMPMRGRKWSPDSEAKYYGLDLSDDKRAAFMPMRGRKKAFYGSKGGKKRLNAFMPMRGKKGSAEDEESSADSKAPNETIRDESVAAADEAEINRALEAAIARGPSEYNNLTSELDKRAQSFYGMRGKRHAPLFARAHKPSGTVKREAVFIASRGKRSSDTKLDNDHSTNVAGQVRNANN